MTILFKIFSKGYTVITLLSLTFILSSGATLAKDVQNTAKIKIKCHVELVGGKDMIHFGVIKKDRMFKYGQWLVGKKIATGFSKQKQPVYNVIECVKLADTFTNSTSQKVDDNTAR
jgi:hypothetical protein